VKDDGAVRRKHSPSGRRQVKGNEWIIPRSPRSKVTSGVSRGRPVKGHLAQSGYQMECCDCGLVHIFDFVAFRSARNGEVGRVGVTFRARRANRLTARTRKLRGIKVT
jgi:hypothetical protein